MSEDSVHANHVIRLEAEVDGGVFAGAVLRQAGIRYAEANEAN